MANDLNRVVLIGRLTRDPEFKIIGQSSVVNFSLANNRIYVSNGEKREETHFFDCEAWGKLADILKQYAKKGKQVAIEGRLKQSTWDTPEGKKASKVRIHVENCQLLGGISESSSEKSTSVPYDNTDSSNYVPDYAETTDDDMVF
ncbi:MAG: single-stranded DNA-binding protein [Leptospiraceae bacterium]|nr:single-stranded DNA-binding protein [Leptospiraceae bacterium]MCK6380874.1 single-stranded DNA-binding protein [Leptospiraceae bacterium]NUM41284.1 single-stranded DNA-binding protein [Leptospiraceae bacterium]